MPRPLAAITAAGSAAALLLTALVLGTSVPAAGAGTRLVDQADRTGDVRLLDEDSELTDAQLRSIDLSRFTVNRGAKSVRFVWRIDKVTTSQRFVQIVEATMAGPDPDDVWFFSVIASPQLPGRGTANFSPTLDGDDTVRCRVRFTQQRSQGTVRVDVPLRCIPTDPGVLRARTFTAIDSRAEGLGESMDSLRVRGRVDLG